MKKSLLALAVAAFAASSVASAAVVYDKDGTTMGIGGRVMAVFYSQDYNGNNSNTAANDGNFNSSSRLNLDLRSEINQYVSAVAFVEWEMAAESNSTKNRYTWVGADFGQFGLLKVGKFEDAVKYVIGPTDVYEDAGCNGLLNNDDRRDGMVMYSWSGYGVDVNLSYGTAKDNQQVDGAFWQGESVDIDNSYAVSVGYTSPDVLFGPISVKAGFGGATFQEDSDVDGWLAPEDRPGYPTDYDSMAYDGNIYDKYTQWAASLSWGTLGNGLYMAAAFQTRNFEMLGNGYGIGGADWGFDFDEYDVTGAEFVVSYGFANGITLIAGYNWMEVDYDTTSTVTGSSDATSSVIPVIAQWQMNPNLKVWVEGRFDAGTDDEYAALTGGSDSPYPHNDENVFAVGAKYTF